MMRCFVSIVALFILAVSARAQTTAPATQPTPSAERVLIVSVDGLRPDVLLRSESPNIRKLMQRGSFSFWARTTPVAVTLPSHVTMLTGVSPEKHKINWNGDVPASKLYYPRYPTLFELANGAGYTTALVTGKSKFVALEKPGTLDWTDVPDEGDSRSDRAVAQAVIAIIEQHRPEVMFVHFAGVDKAGHASGWGSDAQIEAIEKLDTCFGQVVETLKDEDVFDSTLVIVTSDHGGSGKTHGADDLRSWHIPWIAVGPGVRRNFDLTRHRPLVINTEDTFATACAFLGISPSREVEGKPILEVLEGYEPELLQPATVPSSTPATRMN